MAKQSLAARPELLKKIRSGAAPSPLPDEPECEPMTFAQVHAACFELMPRDSARNSNE
jgi:hypothetical protein